ncbi:MAG: tail fiber domain-containing protein [bacterium]
MRTIFTSPLLAFAGRFTAVFFFVFAANGIVGFPAAHAAWDGNPYEPEETLDPECSPNQGQCRITQPVSAGESVPAGSLLYTDGTDSWTTLPIGSDGKVLKISGGSVVWGDDNGGISYSASEQGLHLDAGTHVLSITLDGSTLSASGSGLRLAAAYPGQASITTLGTITTGTWHGSAVAPAYGGTGASSAPANGQLLIGNGSTYTVANASGSGGIQITNGSGSLGIGLSISGLSAVSSAANGDYLALYDDSAGANRKISISDLFANVIGSLNFQGTWDADANSPSLSDGMCTASENGYFYIVGTSGATTLGGVSSWDVGDWLICDGTGWGKVADTSAIASVFGRTGAVTAQSGDYTGDQIINVAAGTIASTNVQGAINELASEKEAAIASGLTTQYWRGDKTWQTLNTLAVAENPAHLYYTDARARNAFSSGSASLSYDSSTGVIAVTGGYSIPESGTIEGDTLVWDGSNWVPTEGAMSFSLSTGLLSIDGTASSTDLYIADDAIIASADIGSLSADSLSLSAALGAGSGGTGITSPVSAGILIGTQGGGAWQQVATSTLRIALADTTGTLSVVKGGLGLTAAPSFGNLLMGNGSGGYTSVATSSLGLTFSSIAGTLGVSAGGTGVVSAPSFGELLLGNGSGGYALAATSTLGLNLSSLTGTLGVAAGGTGAASLGQGWLYSTGGGIALSASTSPTVNYLLATSTTQASAIAYRLGVGSTTPLATLAVKGAGTGAGVTLQTTDSADIAGLTVLDKGFVGIGTTSPVAALAVSAAAGVAPFAVGSSTGGIKLTVAANGFVGVGTSSPTYPLDVRGDVGGTVARFQTTTNSLFCLLSSITGLLSCASDERLKKDITPLDASTLDQVLALKPVSYHWKTDDSSAGLKYGFIAQDVEKIFPELVSADPTTGYKSLSTGGMMPYVVKALQEQQVEIEDLKAQIAVLAAHLPHVSGDDETPAPVPPSGPEEEEGSVTPPVPEEEVPAPVPPTVNTDDAPVATP